MSRASRIIAAAHEAAAIAKGAKEPASLYSPEVDVRAIRKRLGLSQAAFAERFGLGLASVRDYEQHRRAPDTATTSYLKVIEREPEAVERALAL